jgi:acetoacetate decarboxylase
MRPYVEFPGEQSLRTPGVFENTRFFYFVLPADQARLQDVCDRFLNAPSGGAVDYKPHGVVFLAFSHVERLVSGDPDRGTIRYKDIAFWIPVSGGATKPFCLFPPFIFVDDAATIVTGREVFGLPKQLGRFAMPLRLEDLASAPKPEFRAEVSGTLLPGGMDDWRTLLTIEQIGSEAHSDEKRFFSALKKMLLPSALKDFDVPSWLSHLTAVPTVGLKQFRDAANPERACYQAIVEAPLTTVRLHGRPRFLSNAFELTLMDVPSHPVAERLGLSPDPQIVPLTIYFEATMRMDAGTVVWSAP